MNNLPFGIVKSVLSGDTIVIRGKPVNGPPPERVLSLAWISAPRSSKAEQEPFSFVSREFLRKQLVGKQVNFYVEYTIPNGREFASVFVDGINVSHSIVENGMASVRAGSGPNGNEQSPNEIVLEDLEAGAKSAGVGIWSSLPDATPKVKFGCDNLQKYVDENKGVSRKAVIELVRDGSSLRVLFLDDFQMLNVSIGGIRAPAYRKDVPNMEDLIEPFGDEAKFFVEARLLQREVEITLLALNNQSVLANVSHPAGNIAVALISNGLARIVDWAIPYIGSAAVDELRQAEILAKKKRLRIWQNFEESVKNAVSFNGTVNKIVSADSIVVERDDESEVKITFASFRQPKLKEEPVLNGMAREFLRTKLIGKKVQVDIDYVKPPSDGFEQKTCATVTFKGKNIAEEMILKGLAYVMRHKQDDHERSRAYDSLLIAESTAKDGGLGVHAAQQPVPQRIVDASETVAKARSFLPFYQRAGRISAVVEHMMSATKFKLFIVKENCKMSFALTGVRCPRVGRNPGEKSDPFGEESFKFGSKLCLQREVEIEVEGLDKSGAFTGTMWVNKKENAAVSLLEQGLGFIFGPSADQSQYVNQLYTAENNAKAAVKKIWSIARDDEKAQEVVEATSGTHQVIVTEVTNGAHGYFQIVSNELSQIPDMMRDLEFYVKSSLTDPKAFKCKTGDLVCARFSEDKQYYRAKVKNVLSSQQIEVFYIDYGNSEVVSSADVRQLDSKFLKLKPQAVEFQLSWIQSPEHGEYASEASSYLRSLTEKPKIIAVKDSRKGAVVNVTLYDAEEVPEPKATVLQLSINAKMLKQGYAQVGKHTKQEDPVKIELLRQQESVARRNRLGMFEYGDFELEEEPGF